MGKFTVPIFLFIALSLMVLGCFSPDQTISHTMIRFGSVIIVACGIACGFAYIIELDE